MLDSTSMPLDASFLPIQQPITGLVEFLLRSTNALRSSFDLGHGLRRHDDHHAVHNRVAPALLQ
jgi:hypothetical protein